VVQRRCLVSPELALNVPGRRLTSLLPAWQVTGLTVLYEDVETLPDEEVVVQDNEPK
jgi:hypothetical protein